MKWSKWAARIRAVTHAAIPSNTKMSKMTRLCNTGSLGPVV
jgi:hypothetical protein